MIEVAILKNFNSSTYKAGVQLAGSLTTYFDDINVAKNIPSSALVIGNYVILAIPGGNPRDACVIATWPQGSPGGGAGSFLDLSDTPSSYVGQAGKFAKVNAAENALEFISGWAKIAEIIPGSDVDYVDFTGLDINTDKFYMLFTSIKNPLATSIWAYLFVEADYTSSNYYMQRFTASDTTVSAARYNWPGLSWIPPTDRSFQITFITRDPDGYFRFNLVNNRYTGSNIELENSAGSKTAPVTNITQLRIAATTASGIGAGSIFILCKPRSA